MTETIFKCHKIIFLLKPVSHPIYKLEEIILYLDWYVLDMSDLSNISLDNNDYITKNIVTMYYFNII